MLVLCVQLYSATVINESQVVTYLINYGYLPSSDYTKLDLRRSLRQLQRENNFIVTGKVTPQVRNLIKRENEKEMVVQYLKTFNYIQGELNPLKITTGIKLLQRNSGTLNVTGLIDDSTVLFVKEHQQGYSEGLVA